MKKTINVIYVVILLNDLKIVAKWAVIIVIMFLEKN